MSNMSDQLDLSKRGTSPSKIIQTDLAQDDLVEKLKSLVHDSLSTAKYLLTCQFKSSV